MNATFYSRIGKRWLDVTTSVASLVVLSPLLLLVALTVKLTSRGPIFFLQLRVGRQGKLFRIFKFRTMIQDKAAQRPLLTAASDPRITVVGRWLRKTKLDELPQLLNVLRGEMSLVGPRPEIPEYSPRYAPDCAAAFAQSYGVILRTRPGVTGPAAIAYFHEEQLLATQPDKETFYREVILPDKIRLDLAYCENFRLLEDLKIIVKTGTKLFGPRNQSAVAALRARLHETVGEKMRDRKNVEALKLREAAADSYRGKRILVTGAGGSIGSELVRQLICLGPSRIAYLDKDENSIYELEQELDLRKFPVATEPEIADIRDVGRLRAIFSEVRPQVIFHAAAHKHVPLMEKHPCEAVLNNVGGTQKMLAVAAEFEVEQFVFISSDKAVNPGSVMGATKRIGELLLQTSGKGHGIRSTCVRFGNVLGSRGSVLPLFRKQIARGGPVTVTHPRAERYFMTIEEAVELILCAGTLAQNGEIFVLDMGRPRNILELAEGMISLSGLEPGKDIETTFTGLRPGEKLSEELTASSETLLRTQFEKLRMIEPQPIDRAAFEENLARLMNAAARNDRDQIYEILSGMGLGFNPRATRVRAAAAAD
jgi:lipopolysaccharide/colanic/teichoic acid biosynthesis glycosyltransferase/nucleoside-diphosphate-sugar epimerase